MLHQFTWQQFSIVAIILSLLWYGIIILRFYRKRVQELFGNKFKGNRQTEPLPHTWDDDYEPLEDEDDLIGKQSLPEGMTKLSMAEFGFAPRVDQDAVEGFTNENEQQQKDFENEVEGDWQERQLGLIPDALEELKSIFHILETERGSKEDFISLFGLVSSKYAKIKGTASQRALNDYIRDNLPFDISQEELDKLWR